MGSGGVGVAFLFVCFHFLSLKQEPPILPFNKLLSTFFVPGTHCWLLVLHAGCWCYKVNAGNGQEKLLVSQGYETGGEREVTALCLQS